MGDTKVPMATQRCQWGHGGANGAREMLTVPGRCQWGHGGANGDTEVPMGTRRC